ncbi:MAG: acetolactate synthase large subunit [Actinomycetota bacterium]|nr:acetolactate synthase large subunit [Actinomycetota bacterium]
MGPAAEGKAALSTSPHESQEPGDPAVTSGARALVATLVASGVDTCLANPGTSEMHFVAALDSVPGLRPVLGLSEGVVTGAADGYGRVAGRPAAALLHLGPGLANGVANLHNARRARTPVVVVVGDHATYHKRLDAPLESDLDALAGTVSTWVRRSWRPGDVGAHAASAVAAARSAPGGVATLVLPADVSWGAGGVVAAPRPPRPPAPPSDADLDAALLALRSAEPTVILVGGEVVADPAAQDLVLRLATAAGARLVCETFPARMARGSGRARIARLAYLAEMAAAQLDGARHLVLLGARRPVAFFAYPGRPGDLVPDGCSVCELAPPGVDAIGALRALAEALAGAGVGSPRGDPVDHHRGAVRAERPSGPIDPETLGAAVGVTLPEAAVVVDESVSSSFGLGAGLAGAAPHDLLTLTGGAIGFGLPCATGAALAGDGRPVLCLQADGSALYTLPALWTQARESLDVTTVIIDNRSYAILATELDRVEAGAPGPLARSLLDLSRPDLDFVSLARGLGVPASRAETAEELTRQLAAAHAEPGPHLIDAVVAAPVGR